MTESTINIDHVLRRISRTLERFHKTLIDPQITEACDDAKKALVRRLEAAASDVAQGAQDILEQVDG